MSKPIVLRFLTSGEKSIEQTFDKIGEKSGHLGGKMGALGKIAGLALGSIITTAAGVGLASLKMADSYEVSHSHLEVALKNSGTSWDLQKTKVEAVSKAGEKLGFTMTDTEEALAVMTRGSGSSTKALSMLGTAQDLSAAKNISLADAATLVTKASEGQTKGLKALAIDLPVAAGGAVKLKKAQDAIAIAQKAYLIVQAKVHSGALKGKAAFLALAGANGKVHDAQHKYNVVAQAGGAILGALSAKLKGSAASAADTFGGKMKALKTKFTDIGIKIGLFLMPYLEKLMGGFSKLSDWVVQHWPQIKAAIVPVLEDVAHFLQAVGDKIVQYGVPAMQKLGAVALATTKYLSKHKDILLALAIAVGVVLVPAFVAWAAGAAAAAAATVLAVLPVIAITAAVALLVLGIIELVKHWSTVWGTIKAIVGGVFNWVKANWPLLLGILTGPIGLAVLAITKNWGTIKNGFTAVKTWIGDKIGDIVGFFTGIPGRISHAVSGMFDGIKNAFRSAVNWIIGKWNNFSLTLSVPKIHIKGTNIDLGGQSFSINTPNIPTLHSGGMFYSGQGEGLAMLQDGERVLSRQQARDYGPTRNRVAQPAQQIVQNIYAIDTHEAMRIAAREAAWAAKTSGY